MPLLFQQDINPTTRLAIWKIEEQEDFFILNVPLRSDIHHPHKKLQHLAGRYLLPYLFKDFPNEEIEVADTRKPFLPNEQYHFSISHCRDYAAAIVSSDRRVGIDVETITPRVEKIKHKFLHPEELHFVNTSPVKIQLTLLTILWCAKEAMFKWFGSGEVDFDFMMRVLPFELKEKGHIEAAFIKGEVQELLMLEYRVMPDIVLVSLCSDIVAASE